MWNFLFFIHQSIFRNFALRNFFLQETFHIIKNIKGRIKEPTLIYKMKKRRNERVRLMNPQPLEYVLGPEETLEIMEKGTEVSCKLVDMEKGIRHERYL